tara:strand:- start:175 stop:405 length:231 start_codon:yes stop_codon:yes gene_type:complete
MKRFSLITVLFMCVVTWFFHSALLGITPSVGLASFHNQAAALIHVKNMHLIGVNESVLGYHQEDDIIPYHSISVTE